MPFKSLSQRRKFYHLKSIGKMDQKTIDEWEKDTPKDLPEKVAFWIGFYKKAADGDSGYGDGGVGFTGVGKGNILGELEPVEKDGPVNRSKPGGDDTMVDKTLLDRERDARSFNPFEYGPEFESEINHVKY